MSITPLSSAIGLKMRPGFEGHIIGSLGARRKQNLLWTSEHEKAAGGDSDGSTLTLAQPYLGAIRD
jgi:hypothetical protein